MFQYWIQTHSSKVIYDCVWWSWDKNLSSCESEQDHWELVKVSVSQGVVGHDHDSSYDTSTGWLKEADSRVIYLLCENFFHNWDKINVWPKYNHVTPDENVLQWRIHP